MHKNIFYCNDYNDLPDRYIINKVPVGKYKYSYGTIVYLNECFLLVQRRVSIEFQLLINGHYKNSDLKQLMEGICEKEKNMLKTETFDRMFKYVNQYNDYNYSYASKRYKNNLQRIQNLFYIKCTPDLEYYFPKGRPDKNESQIDTAVRETYEETGIDVSMYKKSRFIEDTIIGSNNIYYTNKLWIVKMGQIDWWKNSESPYNDKNLTMPVLTNRHAENEIAKAVWVHKNKIDLYLKKERYENIRFFLEDII